MREMVIHLLHFSPIRRALLTDCTSILAQLSMESPHHPSSIAVLPRTACAPVLTPSTAWATEGGRYLPVGGGCLAVAAGGGRSGGRAAGAGKGGKDGLGRITAHSGPLRRWRRRRRRANRTLTASTGSHGRTQHAGG